VKILETNEYTRMDYAAARRNGDSVTVRPHDLDVEQLVKDYVGPPAYIFWDAASDSKQLVGYAIPYANLTQRADNTRLVFGLTPGCRVYSVTPRGFSKVWKVVEDMGGVFMTPTGYKPYHITADIGKFEPNIIQTPPAMLRRLLAADISMHALTRIVVIGGACHEVDPDLMAEAHEKWQVPVVTFLSFPWLGPVTMTDGATFEAGLVGEPIGKIEVELDKGFFCLRSVMTQEAQVFADGVWQPLGWRFYRSAVRGRQGKSGLYVTERPDVATPPQPMDR